MLQALLIGNIGANAQVKVSDGQEFVTFRVAHNEAYTKQDGTKVEKSMWIDCTMSCANGRPAVLPYLVQGALVFIQGSVSTRVYSSEKDRCMKAGISIKVQKVELLGGVADAVPRRLYTKDGVMVDVSKHFWCSEKATQLLSQSGKLFNVDANGFITPEMDSQAQQVQEQQQATQAQEQQQQSETQGEKKAKSNAK